jgi:hypothetical protein
VNKLLIATALCLGAALAPAQAQTKKELVQKLLVLQQPGIETMARRLAEEPAARMMQEVARVLQTQVAPDKREAIGKAVDASAKKYIEEAVPLLRERAVKLAPSTFGAAMEEKFSEDELKQLIAWFESPVNKKYQQVSPEMQNGFVQKLVVEVRPLIDPKVQALEQSIRTVLSSANEGAPGAAAASAAKPAASGAKPAAAKPAAKPASK